MLRRSLIVAALLAVSSPLAAQDDDEYVWTSNRPDAQAPLGVSGERTLDLSEIEITYRFTQENHQGVWFGTDSLQVGTTLQLYPVAPLTKSEMRHTVMVGYGVTEDLTIMASGSFSLFEREQRRGDGIFFVTKAQALGDITASAIYELYRSGPYRMSASVGAVIPVGKSRTWDCTPFSDPGLMCSGDDSPEEPLPYDMRPGGGTFAVVPGISGQIQNEFGSIGAQFKARINAGTGPRDFTYGDRYEANGWAAYRFNDVISASAGVRWQSWGNVEGSDPALDRTRDPANDGIALAGQRADMPVGVNFVIPGDGPLAGQRLFFESVYTLHHDYEGPQVGMDWSINVGWRASF
jgi:hypothetical protein